MHVLKKYEIKYDKKCLNKYDKQVAPPELNTLFIFNATNSWLRWSQRKTSGSRRDNHAVFFNTVHNLCFTVGGILQYVPYWTVESFKKPNCYKYGVIQKR